MASFNLAIEDTLRHEGGYNNVAGDAGGATNWGISLRYAKTLGLMLDIDGDGDVDAEDMRLLPRDRAIEIYKTKYWDPFGYDILQSQVIAGKIFDMCVNMGPGAAHTLVQRACNDCGAKLVVDGQLGPQSRGVINSLPPARLLQAIKGQQTAFYQRIVMRDPTQKKFLNGWLARADWPARSSLGMQAVA